MTAEVTMDRQFWNLGFCWYICLSVRRNRTNSPYIPSGDGGVVAYASVRNIETLITPGKRGDLLIGEDKLLNIYK